MANETSDRGETNFEANSGAHNDAQDVFFASAHHDHDDVFSGSPSGSPSGGQPEDAANTQPQQVAIDPGAHVIRVPVTPGEVLELAPPFTPDALLAAREANGNLAIKVGDVTVILEGFIDANNQAPVVVETSDGKPIDIATVIAQTDPTIDIQTAAGPAAGPQGGQGADNTGAILALLQGGAGLGGLNAVGAQDGTSLSYGTIDNSIIQDRFLAAPGALGTGFSLTGSMSEPFLRDPIHVASGESYDDFITGYRASLAGGQGYADFNGTQSNPTIDPDAYLAQTTEHITIPSTGQAVTFNSLDFFAGFTPPMSDQHSVHVETADGGLTAYVVRDGDNAVLMVFHITSDGSAGAIQIDAILIDRFDHAQPTTPDSVADTLTIDFNTSVPNPEAGQGSDVPTVPGPSGHVDVLDDVPVAHDVHYTSFYGDDNFAPGEGGGDGLASLSGAGGNSFHATKDTTGTGYVDEDWLWGHKSEHNQGNKDQDNDPQGSNSDPLHGDDIGRTHVTGNLEIDFGADGPAGATLGGGGGNDGFSLLSVPTTVALGLDNVPGIGSLFLDANGNKMTSDGHDLIVLDHTPPDSNGVEHLIVGYANETPSKETFFSVEVDDGAISGTKVFALALDTDPNDNNHSGLDFQDFKFSLYRGIDQLHTPGEPSESNTQLKFDVTGHDDDGDAVHTAINIQVNDDVPVVKDTTYHSDLSGAEGSGVKNSSDFGYVDEDWLTGGYGNDFVAGGPGNQDQDGNGNDNHSQNGDSIGSTEVTGHLNVSFGGDGPTTQQAAYVLEHQSPGDTFVDFDGHSFKSGGHDLVVLDGSDAGHLLVGFHDGESTAVIFELTVNGDATSGDFGDFTFDLKGPIDHAGANEQNTLINFGVTATDADKDTTTAHIEIKVNDDKPEIGITYTNQIPEDYGDSERAIGTVATFNTTDAGQVDEDWLNPNGNHDENVDGTSNANFFGDKQGGTEVTGSIHVKFGGDGPATTDPSAFALSSQVEGAVFHDANGTTYSTHGVDLVVLSSSGGLLEVGLPAAGESDAVTIFTLSLTPSSVSDASFKFDLLGPIDHSPIVDPVTHKPETSTVIVFDAATATDNDGDAAKAQIKISVNDDHPETEVNYVSQNSGDPKDNGVHTIYGQVDEDWLANGNHDLDQNGNSNAFTNGDTYGGTDVHGNISFNYGADGIGTPVTAFGLATQGAGDTFVDANGDSFTQNGAALVVISSSATELLVGTDAGDPKSAVFELKLTNQADGSFTFTLLGAIDNPHGDNTEANQHLAFAVNSDGTDGDGDPVNATINISVNDDVPYAADDCPDLQVYAGNIFTDPNTAGGTNKAGADGGVISQVSFFDGVNTTVVAVTAAGNDIAGLFGVLHISADGTWSYTNTDSSGNDTFQFTIKDGDGDTAVANLSITNNDGSIDSLTFAALAHGPTHTEAASYDVTIAAVGKTIVDAHDTQTYHITDATGGHGISGGAGNDLIEVTGSHGANIQGQDGDDIIRVTAGHNTLSGGNGDDTLFGGSGADDFFGGKGHDAMSGGGGDDVFHNVDAADLDGTNTLDGIHSIDGGDGFDTVQLGGLSSFDSGQAGHIENVEALDFSGKAAGGQGTSVTLSYDAVYNITQVGGLHVLQISGDASGAGKDSVHLDSTGGNSWSFVETKGGFDTYTATGSHGDVSVQVETGVHTDLN